MGWPFLKPMNGKGTPAVKAVAAQPGPQANLSLEVKFVGAGPREAGGEVVDSSFIDVTPKQAPR